MTEQWKGKSLVGGRLGQFEVKEEIARGGMGVVYKGYQPSLDRWVAIKTLPLDLAGDRDLVARFQREAEAMVRLNHANIVQIIDRGDDSGQYYFAMEFVEGPSVKDLLKSETIDKDKVFDILIQTCEGLEYAHKKGLVHRDIKPANLLFEEKTGTVKIADFGIAHFSKKDEDMLTLTADNVGMGTMNYMSPEQKVNAKTVDHRADIYALGVIIYEAFTGKLPLGKFKNPSEINSKLPRQLDKIVQTCLEAEANERYESCALLKAALVEAKASTHDKTLQRSMRDAFDRTLTAFGPNKSVGCTVLVLILLLVLGGGGAGALFLLKGRNAKARLERATAAANAAKLHAQHLHADRETGKSSFDEGETFASMADKATSADGKAEQLEAAETCYSQSCAAAIRQKKDDVKAVIDRLQGLAARAQAHPDGIKAKAQAKLEAAEKSAKAARDVIADAEKPDGTFDGFDLTSATTTATEGEDLIVKSEKLALAEQAITDRLKQAKPDSTELKAAQDSLAALATARDKGDVDGAYTALAAADKSASTATNTPPTDTTTPVASPVPTPAPTPTTVASMDPANDPVALKRQAIADQDASDARRVAEKVLDVAKRAEVTDGVADFTAGTTAQSDSVALKPVEATKKLESATAAFKSAVEKALAAFDKRREDARAAAKSGADRPEFADAAAIDAALVGETDPAERARLAFRQITKFNDAARAALEASKKAVEGLQEQATIARERALQRLGASGASCLATADATLERGRAALKANQVETAATELRSAAAQFAAAAWPTPSTIALASPPMSMAGNLKEIAADGGGIESITGCPSGFVVSFKKGLYCYDLGFHLVAQSTGSLGLGLVSALCAGEGDEFFVAQLSPASVVRVAVTRGAFKRVALTGDLGQPLDDPAYALAYDPRTKLLSAATRKGLIHRYDVVSGNEKGDPINFSGSKIAVPFSLAVLADGSCVVAGESDADMPGAEKDFNFTAARFLADGQPAGECTRSAVAVAPAGDGLVVLQHAEKGQMWIASSGEALSAPPDEAHVLKGEMDAIYGKWATKLSVFGQKAFVLDFPFDNASTSYRPWRTRVKVYDLK